MSIEKAIGGWMNAFSDMHAWWRNRAWIGYYEPYSFERKEVDLKTNSDSGSYEKNNKAQEKRKEAY